MSETNGLPLVLSQLTKSYGAVTALQPTDLEIGAGEFLTLLGPSGSGKTTLLNLIAGYTAPSGGSIRIGDKDVTLVPARHRNIGMVFQSYALFPHMTVAENLAYGLEARKLPRSEISARVEAILALMQLEGYGARRIQQLSGGQQQRVAVARALVIQPDVLLMDEPLGALDRQLRRQVQIELRRLHVKHGRTTIYVTHDQEEALVLSDRIAVMGTGRIQQLGTAAELYARPASSFIAGFIGESNLLEARVTSVSGGWGQVDVPALGQTIRAPVAEGTPIGGPARLMIRPEHLFPAAPEDQRPEHQGPEYQAPLITATVTETVYLGELTQYGLTLPSGQFLCARLMGAERLSLGQNVTLSWPAEAALVVPHSDL